MDLQPLFLKHVAPTSQHPMMVEISGAEGMNLFTRDKKPIMDLISGISVSILGHNHPAIVRAVQEQAQTYMHTMVFGEFVLRPQVELATKLASVLPASLNCVNFTNSGAEAVEGAIKLAKRATGRYDVVACRHAYHGSTHGTAFLMSNPKFTRAYRPLVPNVRFMDFNSAADLSIITENTACVIMETVQAGRGLYVPIENYLKKVAQKCKEVGALFILDEIQAGYGRTGHLFAFEGYDVVPDIICLAKGMGGGMPIGAFVADQSLMRLLAHHPMLGHISTFGGHPVNCAAALATLDVLTETSLISDIPSKRDLFLKLLPHERIAEIRHCGLWFALEMSDEKTMRRAVKVALSKGLLIDWFLFNHKSIRLAPPMIISEAEIRYACGILQEVFDEL